MLFLLVSRADETCILWLFLYLMMNVEYVYVAKSDSTFFLTCPQGASHCSSDPNMLGEMMFGSVAMSYKGSTLKIHQIRLGRKPFHWRIRLCGIIWLKRHTHSKLYSNLCLSLTFTHVFSFLLLLSLFSCTDLPHSWCLAKCLQHGQVAVCMVA